MPDEILIEAPAIDAAPAAAETAAPEATATAQVAAPAGPTYEEIVAENARYKADFEGIGGVEAARANHLRIQQLNDLIAQNSRPAPNKAPAGPSDFRKVMLEGDPGYAQIDSIAGMQKELQDIRIDRANAKVEAYLAEKGVVVPKGKEASDFFNAIYDSLSESEAEHVLATGDAGPIMRVLDRHYGETETSIFSKYAPAKAAPTPTMPPAPPYKPNSRVASGGTSSALPEPVTLDIMRSNIRAITAARK